MSDVAAKTRSPQILVWAVGPNGRQVFRHDWDDC